MAGISLEDTPKVEKWLLHVDGSSTIQASGAGIVITSPHGEDFEFTIKFGFKASNNKIEYEALLISMKMIHEAGARHLVAYSDSQLVVQEENVKADCLSKLASSLEDCRIRHITIQYLPEVRAPLAIQAISSVEDWRTPVVKWLEEGSLPNNRWEAAKLKTQAARFLLQGGILYRKCYTHALL
ncbi:UNVERIFIED_CONTAM: hypothetical protein Scaly_1497000 [Sesamum calycinum]|uniref:RNase H type-1 domain-containing protein n=1 Tax=Sesamum calycinum TaxID=2727403 RepID=A0AAW2PT24_9LAMI